jgi:hypothetical protein
MDQTLVVEDWRVRISVRSSEKDDALSNSEEIASVVQKSYGFWCL